MAANNPHLTIFGFPVYFRISYLIGAVLAVAIWRDVGVIIALTLGVSILVHELGHSLAFRRYGTESHIVIHLLGGYSSPDDPRRLSHREWVIISLAGPLTAFALLGAPAWLLLNYGPWLSLYPFVVAKVLVYFTIYWGAINLIPLWPLDGGRVLYHGTKGNWEVTRISTLGMSAIALIVAFKLGFTFAAIFVAYNAFQVYNSPGPSSTGLAQHSRISDAARSARSFATSPTKTRGEAGTAALDLVYRELLRDRPDRAEEPLKALLDSRRHRGHAETASAWSQLLSNNTAPSSTASPLLIAVSGNDVPASASALQNPEVGLEAACALRVLERRGHLKEVCALLASEARGASTLHTLERLSLDHGLVNEQRLLTAALEHCAATWSRTP